jgi:hypothetical protein
MVVEGALETKVRIRRAHSCFRAMTWDCELTPAQSLPSIISNLLSVGFVDESRSALVRELLHPDEHRVVIIPTTGRVQLRLHYLTPQEERQQIAERFAELLLRAAGDPA